MNMVKSKFFVNIIKRSNTIGPINHVPRIFRIHNNSLLNYCSSTMTKHDEKDLLPISSMPGPKPWPLVGNKLLFTKFGGYDLENFWDFCEKLHSTYGPIVRLSGVLPKRDFVYIFSPEDLQKLFKNEGPIPQRMELDILAHYRKQRPNLYSSVGLVTGNGADWRRLRSAIPHLLKPKVVSHYKKQQSAIANDLVNRLDSESKDLHGEIKDVLPILFRYTLEAVGVLAIGKRLKCLEDHSFQDETAFKIIKANEDTLQAMGESLFQPPLYRIFRTRTYKKLEKAQDFLAGFVSDEVNEIIRKYKENPKMIEYEKPFIASLLKNENLTENDIKLLLLEVFQGGIDATATTLAFCLHFLSRNIAIQEALYNEIKEIDTSVHSLQSLPLLKSVLKETFRLRPSATAISRIIDNDIVLRNYKIPKGTLVSGPPVISCRSTEFIEPNKFRPLRWLKEKQQSQTILESDMQKNELNPFTILPFGHGARMCPGRRLAEQEIYIGLIEIIKNYEMVCTSGLESVTQVMRLNMIPSKAISIHFRKR